MTSKRGRMGYAKSTNGCKTCKIRKVKCDERYPECDRCTHTGRRCDGPIPPSKNYTFVIETDGPSSSPQPPLPSIIQPSLSQQPYDERRAFFFFINVAAPLISGPHDVHLWGQIVPQVAHHSEAVWNAVISIAQLWKHPIKDSKRLEQNPDDLSIHQIQALKWYDRAIRMQRTACGEVHAMLSVLTCTLFASIELQKCNFVNGFTMIRLGFAMMVRYLTVHDMTYSDALSSALIHMYMRSACLTLTSKLERSFDPCSFSDLAGAKAVLVQLMYASYGLIKETYYTITDQSFSAAQLAGRKSTLTRSLLGLRQKLKDIIMSGDQRIGSTVDTELLYDYVDAISLWSDSGTRIAHTAPGSEDQFFSDIVDKAQGIVLRLSNDETYNRIRPAFFNDIVLLPPLYFTATMSTNPDSRHRALDLMVKHTSQKHPEQLHGIIAVEDPASPDGQVIFLQRFRNQWDETGKKTLFDTFTSVVVQSPK